MKIEIHKSASKKPLFQPPKLNKIHANLKQARVVHELTDERHKTEPYFTVITRDRIPL